MFPEYRELMDELKSTDSRFLDLVERHTALDQKVRNLECHAELGTHEEIETLKKEKLRIKDQVFAMVRKANAGRMTSA